MVQSSAKSRSALLPVLSSKCSHKLLSMFALEANSTESRPVSHRSQLLGGRVSWNHNRISYRKVNEDREVGMVPRLHASLSAVAMPISVFQLCVESAYRTKKQVPIRHVNSDNMAKLDRWAEIGALPKNSSAYAASSSAYEPSTSSARRRRRRSRATSIPGPRPRTRSAASGLSCMLLNERVLLGTDACRTSLASHGPNNQQVRSFAVGLGAFLPQRKNLTNSAVEKVRITYLGYCNMRK